MRIKNDFVDLFKATTQTQLDQAGIDWDRAAPSVAVLAAENYPATPRTGDVISGLPERTMPM